MALTRSQQMARIASKDTRPEVRLRKLLWRAGLRYRVQRKVEGIRPDLTFVGARVVVFVDGCQWHGCPNHYVRPRTRDDFWAAKLLANVTRDERQTNVLEDAGWSVVRVWEHEVWAEPERVVGRIQGTLTMGDAVSREVWHVYRVDVLDPGKDMERRWLRNLYDPTEIKFVDQPRSTAKWTMKDID